MIVVTQRLRRTPALLVDVLAAFTTRLSSSLVATVVLLAAVAAHAQPLPEAVPLDTWGPAGTVSAVARNGNTLYVGGSFDYVGPGTGPFAAFDIDSPQPGIVVSGVTGGVELVLAMPGGGWILAGYLSDAGGTPLDVVRIDDQGHFDPSWYVDIPGIVNALATDGIRVFIGGSFTSVNGTARAGLAAVDAATGAVLPWNALLTTPLGSPRVTDVLAHQGTLYVAGEFTEADGTPRDGFAALDAGTAATLPMVLLGLTEVHAMAAQGDSLYLAGRLPSFEEGGVALSISTGQLLPWSIPASYSPSRGLVATPQRVYAATYDTVRALDPVTGAAIGPPLVSGAWVAALAAGDGLLAVAARPYGASGDSVLTFDVSSGQPRTWSFSASETIQSVVVQDGRVAIGGAFESAGGVRRHNLFAMDLRSGRPTSFSPDIRGRVRALATVGTAIVVGGDFYEINGQAQRALAALTPDGALISWAPLRDGYVYSIGVSTDTLFVGGDFLVVGGLSRPNLVGIRLPTGTVTPWLAVPDRAVWAMAVDGDTLVAGGEFAAMAGGSRSRAAAFSIGTGTLTTWNPVVDGRVSGITVAGGTTALVGDFTMVNGESRQSFALVDASGTALPLSLPFPTFGARAVTSLGDQFIVGGRFPASGSYRTLFAVSMQSGLLAWNPRIEANHPFGEVNYLARYPDLLVAGGDFSMVEGRRLLNLAIFPAPGAGPPTGMRARVTGSQATLGWTAPAGTTPSSYVVEAGTAPGTSNVGRFFVASSTITGALPPGTFYARVRAVVNGVEGQASSEVVLVVPSTALPPSAPAGLAASVAGATVSLSWTAAGGNAESYVVEAGTSPGQANLASFDTGALDTALSASAAPGTYYVRIRARNAFGISAPSNEVTVVVP